MVYQLLNCVVGQQFNPKFIPHSFMVFVSISLFATSICARNCSVGRVRKQHAIWYRLLRQFARRRRYCACCSKQKTTNKNPVYLHVIYKALIWISLKITQVFLQGVLKACQYHYLSVIFRMWTCAVGLQKGLLGNVCPLRYVIGSLLKITQILKWSEKQTY